MKDARRKRIISSRVTNAGGKVVSSYDDSTHVVGDAAGQSQEDGKFYLTPDAFVKLYYRSLYNECERFKADETHSPRTFMRIKVGKKTHTKWSEECKEAQKAPRIVVEAAAEEATEKLPKKPLHLCANEVDPITLETFDPSDIVVVVGSERAKHCIKAESAYAVYLAAAKAGKQPRDPLNPAYEFTKEDIAKILKLVGKEPVKRNMQIVYASEKFAGVSLYRLAVVGGGTELFGLGYIPADKRSLSKVIDKLKELLDKGELIDANMRVTATALKLRKSPVFWAAMTTSRERMDALTKYFESI